MVIALSCLTTLYVTAPPLLSSPPYRPVLPVPPPQLGEPKIYVPNALPMYREDLPGRPVNKKRRAELEAVERRYTPAMGSQAKGAGAEAGAGWSAWGGEGGGAVGRLQALA